MPVFLNTEGLTTLAIAVCDRCRMKRALAELESDPNFPGLRVCGTVSQGCKDNMDPYRQAARQTERINLRFPRPDSTLDQVSDQSPLYEGKYGPT